MKKISMIFLGIFTFIIVGVGIFLMFVMFNKEKEGEAVLDSISADAKNALSNPTISFSGSTEYFSFSTGKVVFGAKTSEGLIANYLLIDDFVQTKEIKNLDEVSLIRYIVDDELTFYEDKKPKNKLNKKVDKYGWYESAWVGPEEELAEKNSFSYLTKDSFKDKFRMEVVYCLKGDDFCYIDDFNIQYE